MENAAIFGILGRYSVNQFAGRRTCS